MSFNYPMEEEPEERTATLTGYVRRSYDGTSLKVSMNVAALDECSTYTTSDGQTYIPLVIDLLSLEKVLRGERAVTTILQNLE